MLSDKPSRAQKQLISLVHALDPRAMSRTPPTIHKPPLALTTLAMVGIQLSYSAQINLATPHLTELGLSPHLLSLAWLAGPISGLLVQPLIGLLSDSCRHPLGRRRPFILLGSVLTALSLLLFANCAEIAPFFVSNLSSIPHMSLTLSILAFFMLDFSVQAVQAPLRALLTDIFTGEALTRGNAMLALYIGLGNLIGGALTGAHLSRFLPLSDVQAVFAFAACILLLSSCISSFYTTEPSVLHIKQPPSFVAQILAHAPDKGSKSVRTRIWNVLCALPHPFWPIFMIQLCTWCGFFTLFVFTNAWVGINIFGGVGGEQGLKGELFRTGVRLGGVGNAAMAIVTMLYSLMMPRLLRSFGTRRVYMFSQAVEATCLLSAYFIRGSPGTHPSRLLRALTVTNLGAFGVVWATTVTVPWTLIGNALERDERYRQQIGLFTTLFNASQCIPQFVVAFVAAGVMRLVNDCAVVMALGGVAAAVGIVLIPWFGVGEDRGKRRAKQRDVPAVDCEDG